MLHVLVNMVIIVRRRVALNKYLFVQGNYIAYTIYRDNMLFTKDS